MINFIAQLLTLFTVVIASLINLSLNMGDQRLWLTLLSMSLGCILPSPKIPNKNSSISRNASNTNIKDVSQIVL